MSPVLIVLVVAVLALGLLALTVLTHGRRSSRRGAPAPSAPSVAIDDERRSPQPGARPDQAVTTPGPVSDDAMVEGPTPDEPAAEIRPTRLRDRLGKTRAAIASSLRSIRGRSGVDDATWEELEDALLLADVGVGPSDEIITTLRKRAATDHVDDPEELVGMLREELVAGFAAPEARTFGRADTGPSVWLFVGVNGVGKTTTIAKLAERERRSERTAMLAAADTFRAAAADQLVSWGERVGAPVIRGQDGADPGSVVYDAMGAATSRGVDLLMVDTAGRLHTKVNLMEELRKLRRIIDKTPGALREVLLVLDASTGQNGLAQAREFADAVEVTGVVLTKLDGTAKGGIVVSIERELRIPVKAVGVGESAEDLVPFDPQEFVDAILA